jgi:hypothetical protein
VKRYEKYGSNPSLIVKAVEIQKKRELNSGKIKKIQKKIKSNSEKI